MQIEGWVVCADRKCSSYMIVSLKADQQRIGTESETFKLEKTLLIGGCKLCVRRIGQRCNGNRRLTEILFTGRILDKTLQ